MRSGSAAVAVMTRAPIPGRCKTRLIPALGALKACSAHERLCEHVLAICASQTALDLILLPDQRHEVCTGWAADFGAHLMVQMAGDLGQRMSLGLQAVHELGYERAVLVGSDVAGLSRAHLIDAEAALVSLDICIAPSDDGGYGLIGTRAAAWPKAAALFETIEWGTPSVYAATQKAIDQQGLSVQTLPPVWDVDDAADWARFTQSAVPEWSSGKQ